MESSLGARATRELRGRRARILSGLFSKLRKAISHFGRALEYSGFGSEEELRTLLKDGESVRAAVLLTKQIHVHRRHTVYHRWRHTEGQSAVL